MKKVHLVDKLRNKFGGGLVYVDAVEICVALYCSSDWLEDVCEDDFSKEKIAKVFSELVIGGIINSFDETCARARGASGNFAEAEHWMKIIDSSLVLNRFYDKSVVERLIRRSRGQTP